MPPAWRAGPGRDRHGRPLSSAGEGGAAGPEAGPCGGRRGSGHRGGRVDAVPEAHGHHVMEASVRSDEVEGDGSEAVADPGYRWGVPDRAWGGRRVRWPVAAQTLPPPLVREGACLDNH